MKLTIPFDFFRQRAEMVTSDDDPSVLDAAMNTFVCLGFRHAFSSTYVPWYHQSGS